MLTTIILVVPKSLLNSTRGTHPQRFLGGSREFSRLGERSGCARGRRTGWWGWGCYEVVVEDVPPALAQTNVAWVCGPTQVRTTPGVAFRAVVELDGRVEMGVAL